MSEEMTKACTEFEERIIRYAFHELGFWDKARLRRHLHRCRDCSDACKEYELLNAGIKKIEKEELPELVLRRIWLRTVGVPRTFRPRFTQSIFGKWRLAAVAVMIMLMAAAIWQFSDRQEHPHYSQTEIDNAKQEVETALGIFGKVLDRTQKAIESQASVQNFARPIRKSLGVALKPLLNGG